MSKRETFEERQARAQQQMAERNAADIAELRALAPTIPIPEGWTGAFGDDSWWGNAGKIERINYEIASPDGTIKMIFRMGGPGTTKFRVGDKWYSFDRAGVDDSFYWKHCWERELNEHKKPVDLAAVIREQLERVKDRKAFHERAIDVPEIGFRIDPAKKAGLIEKLRDPAGHITFTPSGFGTGYTIARFNHVTANGTKIAGFARWRRVSNALEDFFGVGPLWIERFDCD